MGDYALEDIDSREYDCSDARRAHAPYARNSLQWKQDRDKMSRLRTVTLSKIHFLSITILLQNKLG